MGTNNPTTRIEGVDTRTIEATSVPIPQLSRLGVLAVGRRRRPDGTPAWVAAPWR